MAGLAAAGCSDAMPVASPTITASPDGNDPVAAPDTPAGTGEAAGPPSFAVLIDEPTPFTEYLHAVGALTAQAALDAEALKARWDAVEESTAACMATAGFEYPPHEFPGVAVQLTDQLGVDDALDLPRLPDARADVERVGYGVDDVEAGEAMLAGMTAPNPDAEYYLSLTASGQTAYDLALTGSSGPGQQTADGGCAGRAISQYPEPDASSPLTVLLEQHNEVISAMLQLRNRDLPMDERKIALDDEWNTCMLDAGYQLVWPDYRGPHAAPIDAYFLAVRTPPGGVAGQPQGGDVPTTDIPVEERYLLGSVEEHEIALADFDCRLATDYEARLTAIQVDLEEQFVAAHDDELAEMLTSIELAG